MKHFCDYYILKLGPRCLSPWIELLIDPMNLKHLPVWLQAGKLRGKYTQWQFLGQGTCFEQFLKLTTFSQFSVRKDLSLIASGHTELPKDQRTANTLRPRPAREDASIYFLWLWTKVAEPLADSEEALPMNDEFHELPEAKPTVPTDAFKTWILSANQTHPEPLIDGAQGSQDREQHFLAPTTMEELFESYKFAGGKASKTTFLEEFNENWSYCLKIRQLGQHARPVFAKQ